MEALKSQLIKNEYQRKQEMIDAGIVWTEGMENLMRMHLAGIEKDFNTQLGCGTLNPQILEPYQHRHAQQQQPAHGSHVGQSTTQARSRSKYPPLAPKVDAPIQNPQSIPPRPGQQSQIYGPPALPYDAAPSSYQPFVFAAPSNQDIRHIARPAPVPHSTGLSGVPEILTVFQHPSFTPYLNMNNNSNNIIMTHNTDLNHGAAYHGPRNSLQGHGDGMRDYVDQVNGRDESQPPFLNWQEHGVHHNPSAASDDLENL